jgi:hypothetical protein
MTTQCNTAASPWVEEARVACGLSLPSVIERETEAQTPGGWGGGDGAQSGQVAPGPPSLTWCPHISFWQEKGGLWWSFSQGHGSTVFLGGPKSTQHCPRGAAHCSGLGWQIQVPTT